jgi:hypothetical protein
MPQPLSNIGIAFVGLIAICILTDWCMRTWLNCRIQAAFKPVEKGLAACREVLASSHYENTNTKKTMDEYLERIEGHASAFYRRLVIKGTDSYVVGDASECLQTVGCDLYSIAVVLDSVQPMMFDHSIPAHNVIDQTVWKARDLDTRVGFMAERFVAYSMLPQNTRTLAFGNEIAERRAARSKSA